MERKTTSEASEELDALGWNCRELPTARRWSSPMDGHPGRPAIVQLPREDRSLSNTEAEVIDSAVRQWLARCARWAAIAVALLVVLGLVLIVSGVLPALAAGG